MSSFLPERACAAAHRSIQQGTADAVVNDVFRGDSVAKEGFWEQGGGTLQNCLACCVFESSGAWHHSFGFWPRILGVGKECGEFGIRWSPVQL